MSELSPGPWKWITTKGAKKLVAADGQTVILEARASRFKPPSVYVKGRVNCRAIEAAAEMIETLRMAEIAMRFNGQLGGAERIKELLAKIGL